MAEKRSWNPLALLLLVSGAFFLLFLMLSGVLYVYKSPSGAKGGAGSALFSKGSVGIIEINGVILDSKKILHKLEKFEDNDQVKAVVLRLNSPGGAVAPSQEIYQAVRTYKKPLVVSMSSVAASGAYYIACGAKKVLANPGTLTGSIGVIMEFANLEKLYQWAKVQRYAIKTGKFKDIGAEYREMTPEDKSLLQGVVDDTLVQFKNAVAVGRQLTAEQVNAVADGRIFSGSQAKTAHLVDELGGIQDAVMLAGKMGGINGKPNVVYVEKPKRGLMDLIVDDSSWNDDSESSSSTDISNTAGSLLQFFKLFRKFSQIGKTGLGESTEFAESTENSFVPGLYWILGAPFPR